jgi:hypothetical protein
VIVLVCGGRNYNDRARVADVLDFLSPTGGNGITKLIHGDATGADRLAERWAFDHHIEVETFPADWKTHGRKAGPIRNEGMLRLGRPDVVVAFPGGRGTADMVRRARAAGVKVIEVQPREVSV